MQKKTAITRIQLIQLNQTICRK